jgi:hypothetical protein
LARLREQAPVHRGDLLTLLGWDMDANYARMAQKQSTVLGYAEVLEVDGDAQTFSIDAYQTPKIFPDPDRCDIDRKRVWHVGFGYGNHMCVGQHLARLEMTRALNVIFDRLPNLRLDPSKAPPTVVGAYLRTPRSIHVKFDRA